MYAFYLSCATLMTYVPVLGAEQIQAKLSTKKESCRYGFQICRLKMSLALDLIMAALLKDTRKQLCE